MDIPRFQALLADLFAQSGHPAIAKAAVAGSVVRVDNADGSTTVIKVAHVAVAAAATPDQPTWPSPAPTSSRRPG